MMRMRIPDGINHNPAWTLFYTTQERRYHVDQNVAHVVFSRAEAANAVNPSFCKDLKIVMGTIKDDEISLILFSQVRL